MKKMWKKVISFAAAATLLLGMTKTAQAAALTTSGTAPDPAKPAYETVTSAAGVTISNVKNIPEKSEGVEEDISFTTYQVVYAVYDKDANALEYHLTDWARSALVDGQAAPESGKYATEEAALEALSGITTTGKTDAQSAEAALESSGIVNLLAAYADKVVYNAAWTRQDDTATASLPVGSYLVMPVCNGMSFLNMLVSVDVSGTEKTGTGDWELTAHNASLKGRPLDIDKKIVQTAADGSEILADTESAGIGDTVNYKITADVPRFPANAVKTTFKVVDTPVNLSIDTASVAVKGVKADGTKENLVKDSAYVLNPAGSESDHNSGKLVVDFSDFYLSGFYDAAADSYPYDSVEITYSAKVLLSAEMGTDENKNTAVLVYDKDPYTESDYEIESPVPKVYTYGLVLTKRAEATDNGDGTVTPGKTLANAEFRIKKVNDDGTEKEALWCEWDAVNSMYVVYDGTAEQEPDDLTQNLATGQDGTVTIKGLDAERKYVLEEVKAPSGYSLNKDRISIVIHAQKNGEAVKEIQSVDSFDKDGNKLTADSEYSWSAAGISADHSAMVSLSLTDTRLFSLPATGGLGIVLFTIGGAGLLLLAAVLLLYGKKRFFPETK
ncbi:MAG: SpaA isopeptide-forming pilin-related protein [Eubacteriales bacterium]|nr:SpaA isopeptide-forming pilin-related protein [Eubacteriales bacterium]